jgi:hypothetical protein
MFVFKVWKFLWFDLEGIIMEDIVNNIIFLFIFFIV